MDRETVNNVTRETVLEVRNLEKSFGRRRIICGASFDVYAGEIFGFLGPNGAGKTTTIKMILGFLFPDSGDIKIMGHDLRTDYEKAMSFVGGIVENPDMFKDFSGLDNLKMYAALHDGVTKERIDEVVRLVGLEKRIRDRVGKYSLGMKQRLGVAQSILHRPRLLILDEPTNGLDPAGVKEFRTMLRHLADEENVAVFVSSHMLAEMDLLCDRVCIIDKGVIKGNLTVEELRHAGGSDTCFIYTVSDPEKAAEIMCGLGLKPSVIRNESAPPLAPSGRLISVTMDRGRLAEVNGALINGGVGILTVSESERSIEDVFMAITGGGGVIE
ncbi:MAG: ABC transporter ATP-binding protein [Clostridia bacterium]|nr:ABC transporter ATP-binding protein [Clostridia bacterium]